MRYKARCEFGGLTMAAMLLIGSAAASAPDESSARKADDSKSQQALEALPPRPLNERPTVTTSEFRSGVATIRNTAATDMFVEALLKSRQFLVVERAQGDHNATGEKQLNSGEITTGTTTHQKTRGVQYIFDGAISEAANSTSARQGGLSIGGLRLGGGHAKDALAVDVRILDAATGAVLDSVSVRKELNDRSAGISGTGSLVGTLAAMSGRTMSPLIPDVSYQQANNDSVDRALRDCINAAVLQLGHIIPAAADSAASTPIAAVGGPAATTP